MARITVEDCLTKETNRFALVQLAAKRTKQLLLGSPTVLSKVVDNKSVVTALREIAEGTVRFMNEEDIRRAEEAARVAEQEQEELNSNTVVLSNGSGHSSNGEAEPVANVETVEDQDDTESGEGAE